MELLKSHVLPEKVKFIEKKKKGGNVKILTFPSLKLRQDRFLGNTKSISIHYSCTDEEKALPSVIHNYCKKCYFTNAIHNKHRLISKSCIHFRIKSNFIHSIKA